MILGWFECRVTVVDVENGRIWAVIPRGKQLDLGRGVWGHFVCVEGGRQCKFFSFEEADGGVKYGLKGESKRKWMVDEGLINGSRLSSLSSNPDPARGCSI